MLEGGRLPVERDRGPNNEPDSVLSIGVEGRATWFVVSLAGLAACGRVGFAVDGDTAKGSDERLRKGSGRNRDMGRILENVAQRIQRAARYATQVDLATKPIEDHAGHGEDLATKYFVSGRVICHVVVTPCGKCAVSPSASSWTAPVP